VDGEQLNQSVLGRTSANRYREIELASRIESASPHGLVTLLYAELAVALDVLARMLGHASSIRMLEQHRRAATIMRTLENGLDRQGGGALAESLAQVYRQLQRRLIAARDGDAVALDEVRTAVADLSEAWARIG
jgi:flagellar secretion chaperone FliS